MKKSKLDNVYFIYLTLGIFVSVLTIMGLAGINPIEDISYFSDEKKSEQNITILIEPDSIGEWEYTKGFPIKITINGINEKNITFLKVYKKNIYVTRPNIIDSSKRAVIGGWEGNYNPDIIFRYNKYDQNKPNLEVSAKLTGNNNCFRGKEFPYVFTFVVDYKINEGTLNHEIIEVKVPII
ncbi:MAG: hypothetical protein KAQ92_07030 [Candidatus Aenigmarchaeota archaeon]|nr:hypothetical protein [Candidatus Aenigmarchaeota archaeon]